MTQKLDATDPRHHQAIEEFRDEFGLFIPDVLLPGHWCVALVDGEPQILINEGGMRALALIAPRPNAPEYVEGLLEAIRGSGLFPK